MTCVKAPRPDTGILGGSIMPFFTESALAVSRAVTRRWVELSGVRKTAARAERPGRKALSP